MLTRSGTPGTQRPRGVAALVASIALLLAIVYSGSPTAGAAGLPGSGYTFDVTWDCGLIYGSHSQSCYAPGNCLGTGCASSHTYGWGSADYDGGGSVQVRVYAGCSSAGTCGNIPEFYNYGTNLARACYDSFSCDDQDSRSYKMFVSQGDSNRHTIYGHGKA